MKRNFLCTVFAVICAAGTFCGSVSAATTVIDFENTYALSDIKGGDKFFATSSNVTDETAVFETETTGTYENKYLTVNYKAGNNVFVSRPILDNDVTVVSARLKFYSGSQAGLILRTTSNQYLAVNNGGGANLRLMNNASYVLTGYEGKWVDVRYVITKKSSEAADIKGYMMLTGKPDTMISCELNNFAIDGNTHLRFQTDNGVRSSVDDIVIKSYNAKEATILVKEDFEQFGEGVHPLKNSQLSSNSLMQTNVSNSVMVVSDDDNKYMALTDASAVLHNFMLPTKSKTVLSFDLKMKNDADGSKVWLRPTNSGEYELVSFKDNNQLYLMGYRVDTSTYDIISEFAHFDLVIDTDGTATTINGYVNGKWITEKSWSSLVLGDFRAQAAAGSEIYLDNITVSIPGTGDMIAEVGDVTANEATVFMTSDNILDLSSVSVMIDGVEYDVDKAVSDGGKVCTVTIKNLDSNTGYNVNVSASDYFGQILAPQSISFTTQTFASEVTVIATESIMNSEDDKASGISVEIVPNDYAVNALMWNIEGKNPFYTSFDAVISGKTPITATLYIDDLYIEDFKTEMVMVEAVSGDVTDSVTTFVK